MGVIYNNRARMGRGYGEMSKTEDQPYRVVYTCEFRMDAAYMHVEGDCLADFKSGFWINEDYELTFGSDAKFWMPPSSIIRVTKELKSVH